MAARYNVKVLRSLEAVLLNDPEGRHLDGSVVDILTETAVI